MDALLAPFGTGIGRRALLEVLVAGAACGPLGVWVLLLRQAYAAESVTHAMLPGLVLAALTGVPLALGAAGGVLVAAVLVALAARDARVGPDAAVAVVATALFGLGAVLALAPAAPPRVGELLFGDLLGVSKGELLASAGLAAAIALALAAAHRGLALAAFDPGAARALGGSAARSGLLLLALLGLTAVVAAGALGNLLVVALIVGPGAGALALAPRLGRALPLAAGLAGLAGLLGLEVSHHLELAAGASVALCAVALCAACLAVSRPRL